MGVRITLALRVASSFDRCVVRLATNRWRRSSTAVDWKMEDLQDAERVAQRCGALVQHLAG